MHPAHVPLEAEPQPAQVHRPGNPGPGGRLLGDHRDAGIALVAGGVDLLQEGNRVQVLPAAVLVRRPLAVLARVVQVQHGRHGVDAQPVDVELLQPVDGVGDQEVPHFVPPEVEDERAPVGLLAAARVGVLVQRGAVEPRQRPVVPREVPGHPVQQHADAGLVQRVDQVAEVVRAAEPRRRRVVGGDLVAPRAAERMLGDGQELHVREAEVGDVARQAQRPDAGRTGRAATSRGAPRRCSSARAPAAARPAPPPSPRRPRRAGR